MKVTVKVKDIQPGDRFYDGEAECWEATDIYVDRGGGKRQKEQSTPIEQVIVYVRYTVDGGLGQRVWDNPNHELEVERA